MEEQKSNDTLPAGDPPQTPGTDLADALDVQTATVIEPQPPTTPVEAQPTPTPETTVAAASPAPVTTVATAKIPKAKWFLPAILAGLLVLGGSAAAYLTVFSNSPEKAWKSALSNTADGLEQYLSNSFDVEQKGFKLEGSLKVSSPVALDGSLNGQWYESDGVLTANVGAGGARINTELRTIKTAGSVSSTPDIYLKVGGLEGIDSLIASFGGPAETGLAEAFATVNNQWFFIDHTLIDQSTASDSSAGVQITEEETKAIVDKVTAVLRDRMFSTSDDKAIFKIAEKLGKEDFEGTASHKIRAVVDKVNFKEFVVALKDSIKGTKAEDLIKSGQPNKTLEEVLAFEDMLKSLEDMDFSKASADVWVEANGAFVRNVRIYPVENKKDTNYLDFGMNYKGGDLFPFQIKATVDDGGDKGTLTLNFELNQKNGDAVFSFNLDMNTDGGAIKAEGSLAISGSNEDTSVEAPDNSMNIFELLGGFGGAFGAAPTGDGDLSELEQLYQTAPSIYDDFEL